MMKLREMIVAPLRHIAAGAWGGWRARQLCRRPIARRRGATGTVSLITTNYLHPETFPTMLRDWIEFVGRRPDEVVVVDGGSPPDVQVMYRRLFDEGLIDKLFVQQPTHPENTRQTCFVQEYYAGIMASGDYLLYWKPDTLPFRSGHDGWLQEYIEMLAADDRLFAITGSSPGPGFIGEANERFWCLEHTSENFALLPRRHHAAAMQLCRDFWGSGWRGTNPFSRIGPVAARCMIESAWDVYCRRSGLRVLMQKEDDTWSVFHTNAHGDELCALRQRMCRREGLGALYNRAMPGLNLNRVDMS
jgi:hypothetical protein